jgi:hypothetical protein
VPVISAVREKHRIGKIRDPISKITRAERAGSMAQVAKHLPNQARSPEFKPQYYKKIIITSDSNPQNT